MHRHDIGVIQRTECWAINPDSDSGHANGRHSMTHVQTQRIEECNNNTWAGDRISRQLRYLCCVLSATGANGSEATRRARADDE